MASISDIDDKVFRISLDGYDANTADPEEFAVHSGFDYPKIEEDLVGTVNYTVPTYTTNQTYTIKTVTHNLGYIPMSQCFVEDLDNITATEFASLPFSDGVSGSRFFAYTTSTQFFIKYIAIGGIFASPQWDGNEFKFKYQIWVND